MHSILIVDLNMRQLSARWVSRLLTVDQRHTRQNMSLANLNLFEKDPEKFLLRYVMMDGTWVQHLIPESKLQSKQSNHPGAPAKEDTVWFDNWEVYGLGFFLFLWYSYGGLFQNSHFLRLKSQGQI